MADATRTGVSIEPELLNKFDKLIAKRWYKNRSEALRDLIRESLVNEGIEHNRAVVATLSMVYDHYRHDLSNKLNEIQHHSHHNVLATTHVHLDHDGGEVKRLANQMLSMRDVKHGKLVMTSTGKDL